MVGRVGLRACAWIALLLTGALAGCVDSKTAGPSAEGFDTAKEAGFDETTGALRGRVTSDEATPISGAQIMLSPSGLSATTALDGTYSFSFLEPGKYVLYVGRLGFRAAAISINLEAGRVTEQDVRLDPMPVANPRYEYLGTFQGYMQCRMATILSSGYCGFLPVVGNTPAQQLWTADKIFSEFKLGAPDWEQVVIEARWTPSTAATNPDMMTVFSYTNRSTTHWFADKSGASPIKMTFTRGEAGPGGQLPGGTPKEPTLDMTLRTWLTLPFAPTTRPVALAYDLRFEIAVTVFYSMRADETYSALPDA
jgi:hypothetical protein